MNHFSGTSLAPCIAFPAVVLAVPSTRVTYVAFGLCFEQEKTDKQDEKSAENWNLLVDMSSEVREAEMKKDIVPTVADSCGHPATHQGPTSTENPGEEESKVKTTEPTHTGGESLIFSFYGEIAVVRFEGHWDNGLLKDR
jgi:hypothetical protein